MKKENIRKRLPSQAAFFRASKKEFSLFEVHDRLQLR